MPRRRPRDLRADQQRCQLRRLTLGNVDQALERYRRFLRRPGRWLYVPWLDCICCDPVEARDDLARAMTYLPRRARARLRAVIAPLDEEFRRRTLPDPHAKLISAYRAEAWWRQRMGEL